MANMLAPITGVPDSWLTLVKFVMAAIVAAGVAYGTTVARIGGIEDGQVRIEQKVDWIMQYLVQRED